MQTEQVAGHTFTLSRDAVCECGVAWAWLKQFGTRERVNENGFAHTGQYTNTECYEVEGRKNREQEEDERAFAAMMELGKQ